MFENAYLPVMSLGKAPVRTGGLCAIKLCRREDVLRWPVINPATGVMDAALVLAPGASLYYIDAIDATRSYSEKPNTGTPGRSYEITVTGSLGGSNAANILSLQTMVHHEWVIIAEDRNGVTRLVGNEDAGATLLDEYDAGTITTSRKTQLIFKWEHTSTAPIYTAQAFDIIIGGVLVTASSLQLIIRFQVGAVGAPMAEGDTLLVNSLLVNKKLLIMIDGMGIPIDDFSGAINWTGSIQRHVEKALASNTINFIGSVNNQEIVEIYAFT